MITTIIELLSAVIGLAGSILNSKQSSTSEPISVNYIIIENRNEHFSHIPSNRSHTKSEEDTIPLILALILMVAIVFLYVRYIDVLTGIVSILTLVIAVLYLTLFKNDRLDTKETVIRSLLVSAPALYKITQLLYEYRYDFSGLIEIAKIGSFSELASRIFDPAFSPLFIYCFLGVLFYSFHISSLILLIYELFLIKQTLFIRPLANLLSSQFLYIPLYIIPINLVVFWLWGLMPVPPYNLVI